MIMTSSAKDEQIYTSTGWPVKFCKLDELMPHEEICLAHARALKKQIAAAKSFTKPVVIDAADKILLDGHHRFWCLKEAFQTFLIPVIEVDYDDASLLSIDSWRTDMHIDRSVVRHAARSGQLLPKKSSKHKLQHPIGSIDIPLTSLDILQ